MDPTSLGCQGLAWHLNPVPHPAPSPPVDPTSLARQGLAWHPDGGSLLAAPGTDNDVVLYERLSWEATGYLAGEHKDTVNTLAFSANGVVWVGWGGAVWGMGGSEVKGE